MEVIVENNDVFIDFEQEISEKSLDYSYQRIEKASKFGCKKLMLNLEKINNLDNIFLDFLISIKNIIPSINLYNVDINILPAFYLVKLDQIVNFYTSKNDAINESKPIVKRRFGIVQRIHSIFLSIILLSTNIT